MKYFSILALLIIVFLMSACEKEVSVSPPDEPPPDGSVFIDSYPASFMIYMNGKYRIRNTPDSIKWLETGSYEILLRRDLFLDTVFTVDVVEGERTNIFIDISKNPRMLGNLSVVSEPAGAEIIINDSSTSIYTPYIFKKMLPGIYKVSLKYENHEDINFSINVKSNFTASYNAVMIDTTVWDYFNMGNSGLPAKVLTCLAIDDNDVKWIGSREGAVSFDGIAWNLQSPSNSELTHQIVTSIAVDSKNAKWITTIGGIGIASDMEVDSKWAKIDNGLSTDYYKKVFIKKAERDIYYFGTDLGLVIFAFDADPFTMSYTWRDVGNPLSSSITSIWNGTNGYLVGSSESGVAVSRDTWLVYNRLNSNIPGNTISAMYESNEGIWVGHLPGSGTSGGLSLYNNGRFDVFTLYIPGPVINTIFVDSRNIKWIGTDFGLFAFKTISNKVLINESNTGLPIKDVTGISEDSNGNIWFSTRDNGLYKLKKINKFVQ